MDVDNIPPGHDFVEVLDQQVAQCDIFLAVIGRGWLQSTDTAGQRRLDNPADFVRIEIESALKRRKRVIPVLVNDAQMPRADELPQSLTPLARRQAVRLAHDSFRADSERLIRTLQSALAEAEAQRRVEEEQLRHEAEERRRAEVVTRRRAQAEQHQPQRPKDKPSPLPSEPALVVKREDLKSKVEALERRLDRVTDASEQTIVLIDQGERSEFSLIRIDLEAIIKNAATFKSELLATLIDLRWLVKLTEAISVISKSLGENMDHIRRLLSQFADVKEGLQQVQKLSRRVVRDGRTLAGDPQSAGHETGSPSSVAGKIPRH